MNYEMYNNDISFGDIENILDFHRSYYTWKYQMVDTNITKTIDAKLSRDFDILNLLMKVNGHKTVEIVNISDIANGYKTYLVNNVELKMYQSISVFEMIFLFYYGCNLDDKIVYDYYLDTFMVWNKKILSNDKIVVLSPKYCILRMTDGRLKEIKLPTENSTIREYI